MIKSEGYNSVPQGDEETQENSYEVLTSRTIRQLERRQRLLVLSNIIFVVSTLFLAFRQWPIFSRELNHDLKKMSMFNPILNKIDLGLQRKSYDNTLFQHSIYAQPPSPEVDSAWFDLSTPRLLLVSASDLRALGHDPSTAVAHPTRPDSYVTMLTVDHQLHCLNSLRKNIFKEHYYPNGHNSDLADDHLQHCIDLLRESLQCHADTDLIVYEWQELTPTPVPNFNLDRKCRNFEALRGYEEAGVDVSGFFHSWNEEEWNVGDGWTRQGNPEAQKNATADKGWWEYLKGKGLLTEEELRGRWGDEGER